MPASLWSRLCMPEMPKLSVDGDLEAAAFKGLVDDFSVSYSLDFAHPGIDEVQSEVGKLAAQRISEGLPLELISLARKAAVIHASTFSSGTYHE